MKELGLADLKPAPAKLDDDGAQVKDPTEEVNLGTPEDPKITYVNAALPIEIKENYDEMPGLDRSLVEHKIPIKENYVPFKQAPRRMKDDVLPQVKKEMERLFEAKFIRPVKYVEWVSNVVPVLKKNGKVRVCVDFRDLNTASPKDQYPMPVADLLVDATVGYQMLSFMDVYIDDVVVKSNSVDEHLHHLEQTLERMRRYNLKMNPLKCAFGVTAGNFLGFLVHQKGIEIDKTKADAILKAQTMAFSPLLKLRSEKDFRWEQEHQKAFDTLKQSLVTPPVLMPPINGKPLKLYISATHHSIATRVMIISQTDIIKYILSRPILRGRQGKWILALVEYDFEYVPQKAVKGQALADFLAEHPNLPLEEDTFEVHLLELKPWQLSFDEYEALIIGLEIAKDLNIRYLKVSGDSQLVIRQITGHYKCNHPLLSLQLEKVQCLVQNFDEICFQHILRLQNSEANQMAQTASGVKIPEGDTEKIIRIQKRYLPFSLEREKDRLDVFVIDISDDWMIPIKNYLLNPNEKVERTVKCRSINYVLLEQDLYRKTSDGLLLLCVDKDQSMRIMGEVHEGTCGAHQAGDKMRWLIKRHGYYWPNIRADCIQYAKGCQQCQKHGPIQRIPAHQLQSIVKPWPFRGWAIDMIGEIHPASSFGIPETITVDQASIFNGREVVQTSQRESTKVTPFELVYGHAAVLPVEINVQSLRVTRHYDPDLQYEEAMFLDIDGLEGKRLHALNQIQAQKKRVERAYNKRVKQKSFAVGDLVWKTILPIDSRKKKGKFGKWSPNWEGPFRIAQILRGGAYHLTSIEGVLHERTINGKYLKHYFPSMWESIS
ncbi:uncharacterized protein LOC131298724 [Rhododendron vialii]|uniref:uncharacterized protein LOC131298724 n=1 Tax=Rhododendron vialii TaxID=182163 RepID=UPI00265FE489|nr:uncharacterized protein LOC131298724 [Rhododendron vialii]